MVAKHYRYDMSKPVKPLLPGERALPLCHAGDEQTLSKLMAGVDSSLGRQRVVDLLATQPFPHYDPAAGRPGLLVRIEKDGTRSVGRFVRGTFRVAKDTPPRRPGRAGLGM